MAQKLSRDLEDRAIDLLSRELKDMVIDHLSLSDAKNFAKAFGLALSPKQKHDILWSEIFKRDSKWRLEVLGMGLVPILIGHGLHHVFDNDETTYLVLVAGDWSGDLRYYTPILDCLRSNKFDMKTCEVVFDDPKITLNIDDVYRFDAHIMLDPQKIFSQDAVSTAALFYGDFKLHTIGPDGVVGIEGRGAKLVATICAIELTYPSRKQCEGARWNQCFIHPEPFHEYQPTCRNPKDPRLSRGWIEKQGL